MTQPNQHYVAQAGRVTERRAARTFAVLVTGALLGALTTAVIYTGDAFTPGAAAASAEKIAYVNVQRMTLPIVQKTGRLQGYMTIDFALEVPADKRVFVRQRIPEARHAVNAAAWKNRVVATGSNGIDVDETRAMLLGAVRAALGEDAVREVRILAAVPV